MLRHDPQGSSAADDPSAAAATLLKVMSTRDGWHADELLTRCDLRVSEINCALLELELTGLLDNGVRGYRNVAPALHA